MIGKGNQNNNFITMDKKKANGSYKRKRLSRDKFSHNRNKKGGWELQQDMIIIGPTFHNGGEKGEWQLQQKKAIIRSTFSHWRRKTRLVFTIEKGYYSQLSHNGEEKGNWELQ